MDTACLLLFLYVKTFDDTPFGLLIRKIAKQDHEAVLAAFSEFIKNSFVV